MVTLSTSAKLKSEVPTRSIGRHRVRTSAMSSGGPDLQRQIEFHTRPVFMRPEFVISRRERIQQCTDAGSGSRDRPLMNITYSHGPDPRIKSTKALATSACTTRPKRHRRITTSAPRARSPSASGRHTCRTERRKRDRVYQTGYGPCRWSGDDHARSVAVGHF